MPLNTDTNGYTLVFATITVVIVALLLAGLSVLLKPLQDANELLDKKLSILGSLNDATIDKTNAEQLFNERITPYIVDGSGNALKQEDAGASLDLVIKDELKKSDAERKLPLYVYNDPKGGKTSIITLYGAGLWDAIGGFMALKEDLNTIGGVKFTHVGETPGLGAEITEAWFQNNFIEEELFVGDKIVFDVLKGKNNPANAEKHKVDGMSGATITGEGVEDMIIDCVNAYMPFIKKTKGGKALGMN